MNLVLHNILTDPSILESPTFQTDKPPSHVDDFKTSDWRDVTDLSLFSDFFRVDVTDLSIDFFRVDRWQNIPKNFISHDVIIIHHASLIFTIMLIKPRLLIPIQNWVKLLHNIWKDWK